MNPEPLPAKTLRKWLRYFRPLTLATEGTVSYSGLHALEKKPESNPTIRTLSNTTDLLTDLCKKFLKEREAYEAGEEEKSRYANYTRNRLNPRGGSL